MAGDEIGAGPIRRFWLIFECQSIYLLFCFPSFIFSCCGPLNWLLTCKSIPQVLVRTIRREIADCSEKAYPSLPISNAKNLLFLNSEGAVVEFARERDWTLHDGRIYFPTDPESAAADEEQLITGQQPEKEIVLSSATIIENSIGYARQLETIV